MTQLFIGGILFPLIILSYAVCNKIFKWGDS